MDIKTRRIYEDPLGRKGFRVLVDRLWPRGLAKGDVHFDLWLKDLAPSDVLRKWFGHDPERWEAFKKKYFKELDKSGELVDQLLEGARGKEIVLLYGAKDKEHNQAEALKEYLERRPAAAGAGALS